MNVYDFDRTIYDGDSMVDFMRFALKRQPSLIKYMPGQAMGLIRHLAARKVNPFFRYDVYKFLTAMPDVEQAVKEFWDKRMHKIYPYYLAQRNPTDIVVSASPYFLLEYPCEMLGVGGLVASKVDVETGRCIGDNCYGIRKVAYFYIKYPGARMDSFYSDSLSDKPMALIAKKSYLVKDGKVMPWPGKNNN